MTPHANRNPAPASDDADDGPHDGDAPDLLVAEPDADLARAVTARFGEAGLRTVVCGDGAEALLQVGVRKPRAVLLAAPLPTVSAQTVVELIGRLHPVPVIVGAGRDGVDEATAALSAGAVAFVARPYRIEEILPLVRPERQETEISIVAGDLELDPAGFHVYVRGRSVDLPVREFMLLRYLMENVNRVVSRGELTRAVWGVDALDSNSLTVHVRRLRNRLDTASGTCCTIDAIRGIGYRLQCDPRPRSRPQNGGATRAGPTRPAPTS
ncbi:response regulator transcription factor [Streptomyces sp. GSL17-111]|uniref:response regulator transcription factor n=1 Tax=Streptomyces sp. GSL17-111 TaxID=3121596 RepID=UPI0030F39840